MRIVKYFRPPWRCILSRRTNNSIRCEVHTQPSAHDRFSPGQSDMFNTSDDSDPVIKKADEITPSKKKGKREERLLMKISTQLSSVHVGPSGVPTKPGKAEGMFGARSVVLMKHQRRQGIVEDKKPGEQTKMNFADLAFNSYVTRHYGNLWAKKKLNRTGSHTHPNSLLDFPGQECHLGDMGNISSLITTKQRYTDPRTSEYTSTRKKLHESILRHFVKSQGDRTHELPCDSIPRAKAEQSKQLKPISDGLAGLLSRRKAAQRTGQLESLPILVLLMGIPGGR